VGKMNRKGPFLPIEYYRKEATQYSQRQKVLSKKTLKKENTTGVGNLFQNNCPTFSAAFLDQTHVIDRNAFIHSFAHIVDRQGGY
jgi:hypothetical protein